MIWMYRSKESGRLEFTRGCWWAEFDWSWIVRIWIYQSKETGGLNLFTAWWKLISACGIYGIPRAGICSWRLSAWTACYSCLLLETRMPLLVGLHDTWNARKLNLTGSGTFDLDISQRGSWRIEHHLCWPSACTVWLAQGTLYQGSDCFDGRLVRGCMCI